MQNQNQNQKEIKFVFRIDSQFAADAAAAADGRTGDWADGVGKREQPWRRAGGRGGIRLAFSLGSFLHFLMYF